MPQMPQLTRVFPIPPVAPRSLALCLLLPCTHTLDSGQLSWMLSCKFSAVDDYPADYILDFCRSIDPLFSLGKSVVRVEPSNARLEKALLQGKRIRTGCPVWFAESDDNRDDDVVMIGAQGVDHDVLLTTTPPCSPRMVGGEEYDYVVIATEAFAVPKILPRNWTDFFKQFKYFPSSVVVHRDEHLMPSDRSTWRPINVRLDNAAEAGMLSVWMNAYNPSVDYGGNVFQSWFVHKEPARHKTLIKADFSRVVHTVETPSLHARLRAVQGRENFYFCGAYAVAGMGLLEQATVSAQTAAHHLLVATFQSRLAALDAAGAGMRAGV